VRLSVIASVVKRNVLPIFIVDTIRASGITWTRPHSTYSIRFNLIYEEESLGNIHIERFIERDIDDMNNNRTTIN